MPKDLGLPVGQRQSKGATMMTKAPRPRLFLDANILFTAAHNKDGKAAVVVELGKQGRWRCFTSAYALAEAQRNLEAKYPAAVQSLHVVATSLQLQEHRRDLRFPASLPAKDQPIFQAALACGADFLLTGDLRHFGSLMHRPQDTFGVHVTTVACFLRLQLKTSSDGPQRGGAG